MTVYMLTVIYEGGEVVDIEFDSNERRKAFFHSIKNSDCKFTFWELEREV